MPGEIGGHFDAVTRAFASGVSRRQAVRRFIGAAAGVALARVIPGLGWPGDAEPARAQTPLGMSLHSGNNVLCVFDDNTWALKTFDGFTYGGTLDQVTRADAGNCTSDRVSFQDSHGISRAQGAEINSCCGGCGQREVCLFCPAPLCGPIVPGITLKGSLSCQSHAGTAQLADSGRGKTYNLVGQVACAFTECTGTCQCGGEGQPCCGGGACQSVLHCCTNCETLETVCTRIPCLIC